MKLIKTIKDKDVQSDIPAPKEYTERTASRGIVFDENKNIALLYSTRKRYHKLPGGGIEKGEDMYQALYREVLEEIGCNITNLRELGVIEEYRNKFSIHQVSYCFIADVIGKKGISKLEPEEAVEGFETTWVSLNKAIKILENEKYVKHYGANFMCLRDLIFLKEAKK